MTRADPVRSFLQELVPVLDADGIPRPVEQLQIVLAVPERNRLGGRKAEMLRHEPEPASLRDARAGQLEEVGQGLRDEEPLPELLDEARPKGIERI